MYSIIYHYTLLRKNNLITCDYIKSFAVLKNVYIIYFGRTLNKQESLIIPKLPFKKPKHILYENSNV